MEKKTDLYAKGSPAGELPWICYLPEIYSQEEDSFLQRYLSVFQWLYGLMTQRIAETPHRLYPEHADREGMEWLAKWCGIEHAEVWDDAQLAYLLVNQNRLSGMRGTKAYMEELVALFTGHMPYIVEYYQTIPYQADIRKKGLLESLYGDSAYVVTVIVPEKAVQNQQSAAILHRLVETASPAGIECRLVILQSCIYLDHYSYIGVNSQLAGYGKFCIDDGGLLPYRSVMMSDRA